MYENQNKQEGKVEFIVPMGIRFTGAECTPEFMSYYKTVTSIQRKFNDIFKKWVEHDLVDDIQDKYINFKKDMWDGNFPSARKPEKIKKNQASLRHLKAFPQIKEILSSELTKEQHENMLTGAVDDILWHVVERYKSFLKRNKKFPKNGVELKTSKALNFKNATLKVDRENKAIKIKTFQKNVEVSMPFKSCYLGRDNLLDDSWRGGNIAFNSLNLKADNEVAFFEETKTIHEMPSHFVSMDVNKKTDEWIAWSESLKNGTKNTQKPENIIELEKQRDVYNKKLRPSEKDKQKEGYYRLNSEQRRKMYGRLNRVMQHRKMECAKIIKPELDFFKNKYKNDFALCIDGVATGASSNSFAQEHVRDVIVNWCKKNGVLCVIVPPAYTSQQCPQCGEFHKQDRKTSNTYLCPSCGYYNESCDNIGALNILEYGKFLLKEFGVTSSSLSTKIKAKNPNGKNPDKARPTDLKKIFKNGLREHFNQPQSFPQS